MTVPNFRKQERGDAIEVPAWWLDKVNDLRLMRDDDMTSLGELLADAIGRNESWSYSSVSRFLSGANTTREMADAFARLYKIPRIAYLPRTWDEAQAFETLATKYDGTRVTAEQARRLALVDQLGDAEEETARDQTRKVRSSEDERASGSRRARRSARRRSPSS